MALRRLLRDSAHLIRPALVLLACLAVFLMIRSAIVPKAFGQYGHYRPGALELVRQHPIAFAGQETCVACHDDEAKAHISMMDLVYSGALVTIVAAPDNTKEGDTDPGLKGVSRHNFITNSDNEGTKREITQPSAEVRDGARIIAPFACRQQLATTAWNSRAWTFRRNYYLAVCLFSLEMK